MRRKKPKPKRRRWTRGGPDHRNVARGVEWLTKIREGIETGRKQEDVIQEMSLKRDRNLLNPGDRD